MSEIASTITLAVPPEAAGERLDRWLALQVTDLSRGRIQDLIDRGLVLRNGLPCRPRDPVRAGDALELTIPVPEPSGIEARAMALDVIYEDAELLVIDKPKGLVVHPAPGHSDDTLVNALLAHCENLSGINGTQRPGIVHRLDKDTTGLLVVAKTDRAHQSLQAQIQAKTARRDYLAIVAGAPAQIEGTIDAPIGRHPVHRQKMAVQPKGRVAITRWRVVERLGNFSLVEFGLETGRTHQIRVHCLHKGWPILGDPLYGSAKSPVNLEGQALHAYRLAFDHPLSGERLCFEAPLPAEMTKLLEVLRRRTH
ncbi:RluA family pseudouridine synthase [Gloeobacter kilaueensis]|uniref:Pseudouridine synthase n=1 Tax=Gloeobacter kilaueensis (strain ATCC BAA-2537 / CCAP 1431/1 / ULC 316 / JS1) TaxID=1183438 RepID=U5QD21_GLOK1|nr:RluA family pseudouridine synthase [Gloeobacter kilaueensis]AGY56753.1 ribosomal large subunit pseudouridine synthase D [Gloeobacter kilaueensis JS1]